LGLGYQFDYHYNIHEHGDKDGTTSDLDRYGSDGRSVSSGPSIGLLYDTRRNSINPDKGTYFNAVYSPKFTQLGSDQNWQSLKIDARKYVPTSQLRHNVLAIWGFAWLTLAGSPPYFDLPSTQWDELQRTGRGYVQGRYRGRDMLYLETEYRFSITHNELLGAVVFANAQSFTEWPSDEFRRVMPAVGTGVRIRINKYSKMNLCLDYAVGVDGSNTVFFNLGEIF
jgi:outer membrane protein assembly factor BamA